MNELSIIIPTFNSELTLFKTISSLGRGLRIYVIDGGSRDNTIKIAKQCNVSVEVSRPNRGYQLSKGASYISQGWILFLHSDTVLSPNLHDEVNKFIRKTNSLNNVGNFMLKFDDKNFFLRIVEKSVRLRCKLLSLPYGDQGLLIHNSLYKKIGGFNPLPLMEDVDLISRINKKNLFCIPSYAVTSSERYKKDGYLIRVLKNFICFLMFKFNFPIKLIKNFYDS